MVYLLCNNKGRYLHMNKKNNKGFTLVELLAVLVILLVIVLLSVNIINDKIKKSEMGSVEVNANNYIKAVNGVASLSQNIGEDMEKGTYKVRDLNKTDIKISGEKPRRGFLVLANYDVSYGCLMYENYSAIIRGGKTISVIKSNCKDDMFGGTYEYTGAEQVFTAELDGWYSLKVWGAQGGNSSDSNVHGGYGGYSTGYVSLKKGDKLYINVGQQGAYVTTDQTVRSYNGGGACRTDGSPRTCGNGGGATSIAFATGELSALSSKTNKILIVAGGGGGASTHATDTTTNGGNGGGFTGGNGASSAWGYGAGGTQLSGGAAATTSSNAQSGSFGSGGNGAANAGAGGGGGYYGGGGGHGGSGGGGSSYIASNSLFKKEMYCYNCTSSDDDRKKTISTTCASETATDNCAKLGDGAAEISYVAETMSFDIAFKFDYTGTQETLTIPLTGNYKLEVWGAQGGNSAESNTGGYGGYSVGTVKLKKNDILYITVGGGGNASTPGYNGGGSKSNNTSNYGGGATHIATKEGLLSALSDSVNKILIVAGGGGGTDTWRSNAYGGHAGGFIGSSGSITTDTTRKYAKGGTQEAGGEGYFTSSYKATAGTFGQGGKATQGWGSGAGGGFYGGGGGGAGGDFCAGGGGGSGYIGNSSLTNKSMYCYECAESSEPSTKTINTTCVDTDARENCAKRGNGYVKITYLD